jgi:hypothetical protein
MDEGLAPRAQEPRRPLEMGERAGVAGLPADGSRDSLVMQVLSTEHFSLLSQRSLAYNEAFTRVGMFLTFLSMSFVALALLSGAMPIDQTFLVIAMILLGFDLIIGLTTFVRVGNANSEDLDAMHGMARVRHGYLELAPEATPYFTTPTNDDPYSVLRAYSSADPSSLRSNMTYGLSTSGGMLGLVLTLVGGAFGAVVALALGLSGWVAIGVGVLAALALFITCFRWAMRRALRHRMTLEVRFPAPAAGRDQPDQSR